MRQPAISGAIDFGAINDSEKTMFTIVKGEPGVTAVGLSASCQSSESFSVHREEVSKCTHR